MKYEFMRKASIVVTKTTGIIAGALSFAENVYDGKMLPVSWSRSGRSSKPVLRWPSATVDIGGEHG
jgi:hypothetical protein